MDTVKEVVGRDCGGTNPLVKLTEHFTKDSPRPVGLVKLFLGGVAILFDTDWCL